MEAYNQYTAHLEIKAEEHFLKAEVKFSYICKIDHMEALELYIHKDLKVHHIDCKDMKSYKVDEKIADWSPFVLESKRIKVYFNRPLVKGERIEMTFDYSGYIKALSMMGVNRITKEWVELGLYSPWYPLTKGLEEAWFKVNINIEPKGYVVVGSNRTRMEGGSWIIDQEIPFVDCSFVASQAFKDKSYRNKIDNMEIGVYYIEDKHETMAYSLSQWGYGIFQSFSEKFGSIDMNQYSIAIVPRNTGGGYNRPGLIVLHDMVDDGDTHFKYKKGEVGQFKYLAHEMAHLWWSKGDATTWEDWLNESFAEYTSLMAVKDYYGQEAFDNYIREYREKSKGLPPIKEIDRGHEKAFDVLYVKGPVFLYELENEIGRETFLRFLGVIHTEKVRTTENLLERLSELTSRETSLVLKKKLEA